jgi:hypothetical protein
MCLTPYWECSIDRPIGFADFVKPGLFILLSFVVAAAAVLYTDFLLITQMPEGGTYRWVLVAATGAAVATIPRLTLAAFGNQGLGALVPQIRFLPFLITGAAFALILDRSLNGHHLVVRCSTSD